MPSVAVAVVVITCRTESTTPWPRLRRDDFEEECSCSRNDYGGGGLAKKQMRHNKPAQQAEQSALLHPLRHVTNNINTTDEIISLHKLWKILD